MNKQMKKKTPPMEDSLAPFTDGKEAEPHYTDTIDPELITAISKWESGKGYPNIESLKCNSKFFSVTIDELLSGEELITLAETENRSNLKKIYSFIYGCLLYTSSCV